MWSSGAKQRREFPLDAKPEVALLGKVICTTGARTPAYVDWTQIAYADEDTTDVIPRPDPAGAPMPGAGALRGGLLRGSPLAGWRDRRALAGVPGRAGARRSASL